MGSEDPIDGGQIFWGEELGEVLEAHAATFTQKYSGKEQLLTTLREVALGEFRIPGDAARRLARAVGSPSDGDGSELLGTLTERER